MKLPPVAGDRCRTDACAEAVNQALRSDMISVVVEMRTTLPVAAAALGSGPSL